MAAVSSKSKRRSKLRAKQSSSERSKAPALAPATALSDDDVESVLGPGGREQRIPLPAGFMLTGLTGFLIVTTYTLSGRFDPVWGFAFDLIFLLMFIASIVSMTPTFPSEFKQDKKKKKK